MSDTLPTGQLSNVPWRRTGVKYTNNEAYFDVVEEIDVIIDKSGSTVFAEIQGYVCSTDEIIIIIICMQSKYPLPSARQRPSYGDCLEDKREYYRNSSVLDCVTQFSQSAAHLYEQFLQVQQIRFVTLGPLRCV